MVWFTARTEVDKVNRQVTLDNFEITKVTFPMMKAKEAEFQAFLQAKLPGRSKVIALDRLEAVLAANDSEQAGVEAFPVNNEPPKVIFTTKPSLLVLIDGPPQYRDVGGTDLQLMLNTRTTILLDAKKKEYYLNVMDGWLQATDLIAGPWSFTAKIPDDMKEITKGIQERQQAAAQESSPPPSLKQAKEKGNIPVIYVSVGPGELLVTEGPPQFEIIPTTNLEHVKNTTANIFRKYPGRLGESLHGELWCGKPNRFPKHATRHQGCCRSRRQYQHLHRQYRRGGVGPWAITRRPALWLAAALDTRAICTVAKERLAAAALPTTQTLAPESPRALTTFTREKTATYTAITVRPGIGLKTAATGGNPRPNPSPIYNNNNRHVP